MFFIDELFINNSPLNVAVHPQPKKKAEDTRAEAIREMRTLQIHKIQLQA